MLRFLAFLALFVFIYAPPSSASSLDDLFFEDGYQKKIAKFLIAVSADVYINCELGDIKCQQHRNQTLSKYGFENISFYNLPQSDTQGLSATRHTDDGKNILLIAAFRGSQETFDWITNLKFIPIEWRDYSLTDKSVKVHKGFAEAFGAYKKEIHQKVSQRDMYDNYDKIIMTGHSLGGALATLMYAYLNDLGLNDKLLVYTFGAPAVGDEHFFARYDPNDNSPHLKKNFYRILNDRDPIPFVTNPQNYIDIVKVLDGPTISLANFVDVSYFHIGNMIVYNDGFRIKPYEYESKNVSDVLLSKFNITQHYTPAYISNILCDFKDVKRRPSFDIYTTYYKDAIETEDTVKTEYGSLVIDGQLQLLDPEKLHQSWFSKAIVDMCTNRIIEGYTDDRFYPSKNVSRAEFLKILLLSSPSHPNHDHEYTSYAKDNLFSDVSQDEWYSKYVGYAKTNNLVQGYVDNTFKPSESITRAEASKLLHDILVVSLSFNSQVNFPKFYDLQKETDSNKWFYHKVYNLAEKSIINGYPDGKFRAINFINRAEATVMVHRALCLSSNSFFGENRFLKYCNEF